MADRERYLLYARKSTDVEDKQVRSIDGQLFELNALASRSRIDVADIIVERESAKTPGARSAFNAMLDKIESGDANAILAWHPDRLARNMTDGGRIIDLIDKGKIVALRFPTFWFEPTPQGKFMLAMAFSQSKYYVDALSENTKRGQREKVRRGEFPGFAPLGYRNDRLAKRITLDRERAPIVRRAFERYATGKESIDSIRHFLADNGILSRTGRPLSWVATRLILANPIYYGCFKWAGEIHDGIHDKIITKRLFDNVQTIFSQRARHTRATKKGNPKPFTGLLRCADCGCAITAEVQKGHTYYRCTKKRKAARCSLVNAD